ncbi:MAG: response regulator [Sandaracinaceae bacterium]
MTRPEWVGYPPGSHMDIRSVLLIDDEADIRTIGELALSEVGGLEVFLADSGETGLLLAKEKKPDVVLLDVMMPGLDGPSTFERLREDPETASVPVIFMTAKIQKHEVDRYRDLGATGIIAKPFDPMSLADEVKRIAGG